jgi:hypothetical protein
VIQGVTPFLGPTYNLESRPASVQRTVNMVPVPIEAGNERTGWVFQDVPGLTKFADVWDTGASLYTLGYARGTTNPSSFVGINPDASELRFFLFDASVLELPQAPAPTPEIITWYFFTQPLNVTGTAPPVIEDLFPSQPEVAVLPNRQRIESIGDQYWFYRACELAIAAKVDGVFCKNRLLVRLEPLLLNGQSAPEDGVFRFNDLRVTYSQIVDYPD